MWLDSSQGPLIKSWVKGLHARSTFTSGSFRVKTATHVHDTSQIPLKSGENMPYITKLGNLKFQVNISNGLPVVSIWISSVRHLFDTLEFRISLFAFLEAHSFSSNSDRRLKIGLLVHCSAYYTILQAESIFLTVLVKGGSPKSNFNLTATIIFHFLGAPNTTINGHIYSKHDYLLYLGTLLLPKWIWRLWYHWWGFYGGPKTLSGRGDSFGTPYLDPQMTMWALDDPNGIYTR